FSIHLLALAEADEPLVEGGGFEVEQRRVRVPGGAGDPEGIDVVEKLFFGDPEVFRGLGEGDPAAVGEVSDHREQPGETFRCEFPHWSASPSRANPRNLPITSSRSRGGPKARTAAP